MISFKELAEIPAIRIFIIISILTFAIFPNLIYTYTLDRNLFIELDFWKLFLLTTGFGLIVTSFNVIISFFILTLFDFFVNKKINTSDSVISPILMGFMNTLSANVMFSIILVLQQNKTDILYIGSIEKGVLFFWFCNSVSVLTIAPTLYMAKFILKYIKKYIDN